MKAKSLALILQIVLSFTGCMSSNHSAQQEANDMCAKHEARILQELTAGYESCPTSAADLLNLTFSDWMTKHRNTALHYLSEGRDKPLPELQRLLIDGRYVPKGFSPSIAGIKTELVDLSKQKLQNGELYIRVDLFQVRPDNSVVINFSNQGPYILGGMTVKYEARKTNDQWVVQFIEGFDP